MDNPTISSRALTTYNPTPTIIYRDYEVFYDGAFITIGGDSYCRGETGVLFDVAPKERREDLYDRNEELNDILKALTLGERLIVVYGI